MPAGVVTPRGGRWGWFCEYSKAATWLSLCHGQEELLLRSRRWRLQWLMGAENLQERPRPFSFFLPFNLSVTLAIGRIWWNSWESRKVQSQPQNHMAECRRATFKLRDNYWIIKLPVISHTVIQLSLVLSSCLTTAAYPPGRHNITLPKQVLNFVDFFPSFSM